AAQASAGDLPAALATLAKARPAWSRDLALGAVAAEQASPGDVTGALATAGLITTTSIAAADWQAAARAMVGEIQARRGQVREASRAGASLSTDADSFFFRAVSGVAEAQAGQGDVAGALQTLELLDPRAAESGLAEVAEAQALAGDPSGAVAT